MSSEIENLLRQMPLRKPSADLDARVLAGRPRARRAWLAGAVGGALAAAAAVILAVGLPQNMSKVTPGPQPGPAAAVEPVRIEQNWSEVSYEEVVCPDPETPMQTFRRRTVDHVQFFDPQRNIRMETIVPREEIIFVKASMQ
jgi:hypothetical protein